jgi:hypothetical protein
MHLVHQSKYFRREMKDERKSSGIKEIAILPMEEGEERESRRWASAAHSGRF